MPLSRWRPTWGLPASLPECLLACGFHLRLFCQDLSSRESSGSPSVGRSVCSFICCSRRSIFSPFRDEKDVRRPFEKISCGGASAATAAAVSVLLLDFLRPPRSIDRRRRPRRRNVSRRTAANNDFLLRGMMCAIKVCIHKEGRKE